MIGGVEQHLAHLRIIRRCMRELAKADADGHYDVDVPPLPDAQVQFLPLLCCPSACTRTFQIFDGLVSVQRT